VAEGLPARTILQARVDHAYQTIGIQPADHNALLDFFEIREANGSIEGDIPWFGNLASTAQ